MGEVVRIVVIGLAIYAVYLPTAWLLHRDYVPDPRPTGAAVERIDAIHSVHPDQYASRSSVFRSARFPNVSRVVVYEDMTPLPKKNYELIEDFGAYVIRFQASDGSDPRTNGRRYWTVMPY
jgi:hypothetical protein